jgi:hypothetical protein
MPNIDITGPSDRSNSKPSDRHYCCLFRFPSVAVAAPRHRFGSAIKRIITVNIGEPLVRTGESVDTRAPYVLVSSAWSLVDHLSAGPFQPSKINLHACMQIRARI